MTLKVIKVLNIYDVFWQNFTYEDHFMYTNYYELYDNKLIECKIVIVDILFSFFLSHEQKVFKDIILNDFLF